MANHIKPEKAWKIDAEAEADRLLLLYPGESGYSKIHDIIRHQFEVIQSRSQLLLTVGTLTLTITGFSGPTIAKTNLAARVTMALGIVFVLIAILVLLTRGLRIHWITQFEQTDKRQLLVDIIQYRDHKTRIYMVVMSLLVVGLGFYVSSIVNYLMYYTVR
jgi:hypothetical protein